MRPGCVKFMLAFIAFILLFLFFGKTFREGLENNLQQTSCTQFYDCKSCINGQVTGSSSPCYWNDSTKKCGSFDDPGYKRTCS